MRQVIFSLLSIILWSSSALSAPQGFTLQGRIFRPNGSALDGSSVAFTIRVASPGAENCTLYEETQTLNMSAAEGAFSLTIGAGARTANDAGLQMTQVFSNTGTLTALTCSSGSTYTPITAAVRMIYLTFDEGTGPIAFSTPFETQSVPYSIEAERLNGYLATDFVRMVDTNSQVRFTSVFDTRYPLLDDLLNGVSTLYVKSNGAGFNPTSSISFNLQKITNLASPTLVSDAATKGYTDTYIAGNKSSIPALNNTTDIGKTLVWTGLTNGWAVQSMTNGTVTSVGLQTPSIFNVSNSPIVSSGVISVTLANQSVGTVFAGPASGGAAAPTFRSLASTDLPNIQVAQGGTGQTSWTANSLVMANASGTGLTSATCATGELLQWSGTAWACQGFASLGIFTNGGNSFGSAASIGTNDANTLSLETNNTARVTIDSTGNVGVGTVSPNVSLDVNGGVRAGSTTAVTACGLGAANGEGTQRYNYTSHNMEFCNGSSWVPLASSTTQNLQTQTFTSSGTFTTPAGTAVTTRFRFTILGAGGGGGGCNTNSRAAGGGGAGGYAIYEASGVAAGTNITVTVGAAGTAAASPGAGGLGGLSSVVFNGTTVTANGGAGAVTCAGATTAGGAGGSATNGTLNVTGGTGRTGSNGNATGNGASSIFGSGGAATTTSGGAAVGYGSGGAGGSGTGATGGAGAPGLVMVQWVQ